MKKIYSLFILFCITGMIAKATNHVITANSNLTYSPAALSAVVGDQVTINTNVNHPTVEVSQATWNANGTTPLPTGFGTITSSFTFTLTTVGDIYYVCSNHVSSGMKGMISVTPTGINEQQPLAGIVLSPSVITSGKEISLVNSSGTKQEGTLMIYNLLGSVVYSSNFSTIEKQSFSINLPAGTYYYKLKNNAAISKGKRIMIVD